MLQNLLLTSVVALSLFAQSPPENGWTSLAAGQNQSGLRYEKDGTVWLGTNKLMSCPAADYRTLDVSTPSPRKGFFVLMCDRAGEYADVYVVQSQPAITAFKVVSKNVQVEQKNFIDKDWVSWSPDEQFALFASGGEGFQGPMVLVNLTTQRVKEIEYKHLGLKGETEILEKQRVSWLSGNSFRMQFNVVCQVFDDSPRCASGPCKECDSGVHRTYWVRVNLSPFFVSYGQNAAPKSSALSARTSRRVSPPISASRPATSKQNEPVTVKAATDNKKYRAYVGKDLNVLLREVPDVKRRLIKLLGRNYQLFMKNLTVSSDMEDEQGFLKMHGLAPHMGTVEEAVFLLSFSTGRLHCTILSQRFGNRYKLFSEDPNSAPTALIDHLIYR